MEYQVGDKVRSLFRSDTGLHATLINCYRPRQGSSLGGWTIQFEDGRTRHYSDNNFELVSRKISEEVILAEYGID